MTTHTAPYTHTVKPYGDFFKLTVSHDILDQKGRTIGGEAVVSPSRDEAKPWDLRIYSLRNGQKYGAIPRGTLYATREEAEQAGREKLALQGKRYRKLFPVAQ